ncbi:hypothetical protein O1L60_04035 [Streptomyces diastatochromogenes]|nr:hypothetical protein [Streptomyces diastatochromogenes]
MYTKEFFDELALPFPSTQVTGATCYAVAAGDNPLVLKIDFSQTIRHKEYDGLRLSVVHSERGILDTVHLKFAQYGTFSRRDAGRGGDGRDVFRDWHSAGVPWEGADFTNLRTAIMEHATLWCPGLFVTQKSLNHLSWSTSWHEQLWATDTVTLSRLHEATQAVLNLVESGVLHEDVPLLETLKNARFFVMDVLGLPLDQGMLAEAAVVTQLTGRRLGPETADALARIDAMPLDDQRTLVQAALRRQLSPLAARRNRPATLPVAPAVTAAGPSAVRTP